MHFSILLQHDLYAEFCHVTRPVNDDVPVGQFPLNLRQQQQFTAGDATFCVLPIVPCVISRCAPCLASLRE